MGGLATITARPARRQWPAMKSLVSEHPAATPQAALAHFQARLAFETDCADVHESLKGGKSDFVLVDARGPEAFARAHVPGALNIPHRTMTRERMSEFPADTLFVVYCAGPHCNGANRAAVRLAGLGYRVKEMIGGVSGWREEGFPLE
jgi:rhodanese-related sulfurtransferase